MVEIIQNTDYIQTKKRCVLISRWVFLCYLLELGPSSNCPELDRACFKPDVTSIWTCSSLDSSRAKSRIGAI